MARQANGTYQQPASTAAVSGATIGSAAYNTLISDIGNEITNSVDRAGRSAMTASLPMGGQKIINMADPASLTDGATKNYVDAQTAVMFSTGDVKLTLKTAADAGWLMCDDGTIGNTGSGAGHTGTSYQALYTLLWTNVSDTYAPVTGGRGASAAADWAGLKPISLTKVLGRALGISGAGSGLTARSLGQTFGEENHTLAQAELPNVNFNVTIPAGQGSHHHTEVQVVGGAGLAAGSGGQTQSGNTGDSTLPQMTGTAASGGSGTALNNMQPTSFLNVMIKL